MMDTVSTQEKPTLSLADIAKIKDHATRVRAAVEYRAYALARAKEALDIRDAAMAEMKADGTSLPKIAEATGVNIATVKAVLR